MRYEGKDASDAQCCTLFNPCITQLEAYRERSMQLWSTWAEMVHKVLYHIRSSARHVPPPVVVYEGNTVELSDHQDL